MGFESAHIPYQRSSLVWTEGVGRLSTEEYDTKINLALDPGSEQEILSQEYPDGSGRTIIHLVGKGTPRTIEGLSQLVDETDKLHELGDALSRSEERGGATESDFEAFERFQASREKPRSFAYCWVVSPDGTFLQVDTSTNPEKEVEIALGRARGDMYDSLALGDYRVYPIDTSSCSLSAKYDPHTRQLSRLVIQTRVMNDPHTPENHTDTKATLQHFMQTVDTIRQDAEVDKTESALHGLGLVMGLGNIRAVCLFTEEQLAEATNYVEGLIHNEFQLSPDNRFFQIIKQKLAQGGLNWIIAEQIRYHGMEFVSNNINAIIEQWSAFLLNSFKNETVQLGIEVSQREANAYSWRGVVIDRRMAKRRSVTTEENGLIGANGVEIQRGEYTIAIVRESTIWHITIKQGDEILGRMQVNQMIDLEGINEIAGSLEANVHELSDVAGARFVD